MVLVPGAKRLAAVSFISLGKEAISESKLMPIPTTIHCTSPVSNSVPASVRIPHIFFLFINKSLIGLIYGVIPVSSFMAAHTEPPVAVVISSGTRVFRCSGLSRMLI